MIRLEKKDEKSVHKHRRVQFLWNNLHIIFFYLLKTPMFQTVCINIFVCDGYKIFRLDVRSRVLDQIRWKKYFSLQIIANTDSYKKPMTWYLTVSQLISWCFQEQGTSRQNIWCQCTEGDAKLRQFGSIFQRKKLNAFLFFWIISLLGRGRAGALFQYEALYVLFHPKNPLSWFLWAGLDFKHLKWWGNINGICYIYRNINI